MRALPDGLIKYKQTRSFTERTVPKGLLAEHSTKEGVWGRIVVESGLLRFVIEGETHTLSPERPGIIPPELTHRVEPLGPVLFRVEFLRADPDLEP